jgi:hypothetical protein
MWSGLSLKDEWRPSPEGSPNLANTGFAGNSKTPEGSEPKNAISAGENTFREVISKKGSEGSEGSEGSVEEDFDDLRGIFESGEGGAE